jgi:lipoprotein-releasing system permease protein
MSKTLVMLLVLVIVAVAAFNIVSTLVLAVNDKKPDVAILRTMGANSKQILSIFIVQGAVIGLVGVSVGAALGVLLSAYIGDIVHIIELVSGRQFLDTSIYPINYLPSDTRLIDVLIICAFAQVLSMLATIFPAILAMGFKPAEVLRYE